MDTNTNGGIKKKGAPVLVICLRTEKVPVTSGVQGNRDPTGCMDFFFHVEASELVDMKAVG